MKQTRYRILLAVLLCLGVFSVAVIMAGCASSGPTEPVKSPRQQWIETHPTSMGDAGECLEADGEECDADPYDLDDMFEVDGHGPSRVATPKVTSSPAAKPKTVPKPGPTRRR